MAVGRNGFAEASWVKAGVTWLEVSLGLAGVVLRRFKSEVQQGSIDGMAE